MPSLACKILKGSFQVHEPASELDGSSAGDLDAWSSRPVTVFPFFSYGPEIGKF